MTEPDLQQGNMMCSERLLSSNNVQPEFVDPSSAAILNHDSAPLATILIVEDEEFVRCVTREVLECEGYRVVEAEDAIDGLRVCELHRGKIDLLLTDVVMPGMNGRDMAKKLTELHPGLRVMFMSGYTDNPVLREAFADINTVYLQKPFTVQTLRGKVRDVLAGRTPAEYDGTM